MDAVPAPLDPGTRAPDFVAPSQHGDATRFYGAVGGAPLVMRFGGAAIAVHPADGTRVADEPLLVLDDTEGTVAQRYRSVPGDVVVLDQNLRVLAVLRPDEPRTADGPPPLDDELLGVIATVLEGRPATAGDDIVSAQAPVLLVPNVLHPSHRRWLLDMWASGGAAQTGVETTTEGGRAEILNAKRKRRRDHVVGDQATTNQLAQIVGRAVIPEIQRAFHYRATRFEGFKIGRYDADSAGFFSAHRDNLSPQTLHRRFALSLNLNDEYEGGEVRFPEFGGQRYRPPAGGALVFSGAHLHEVLPVTAGERYVLLSFLYGDDAVRR